MKTCKKCGKEFLTEADPYAVIPTHEGVEYNCGCYFVNKKMLNLAAMAMQGYCAGPHCVGNSSNEIAKFAVEQAKALIAELNKERE